MNRPSIARMFTPLVFLSILSGCAATKPPGVGELQTKYLGFLSKESATREDVLVQLGTPSSAFENGRILTYRLHLNPNHGFVNSRFAIFQYGLTVVFDENGRVAKYKLRKQ